MQNRCTYLGTALAAILLTLAAGCNGNDAAPSGPPGTTSPVVTSIVGTTAKATTSGTTLASSRASTTARNARGQSNSLPQTEVPFVENADYRVVPGHEIRILPQGTKKLYDLYKVCDNAMLRMQAQGVMPAPDALQTCFIDQVRYRLTPVDNGHVERIRHTASATLPTDFMERVRQSAAQPASCIILDFNQDERVGIGACS